MRATYEAHVARSCRWRAFEPSVPEADLAEVAKGKYLRRDAAALATRMLDDAREALRQAKAAGDAGSARHPLVRHLQRLPVGVAPVPAVERPLRRLHGRHRPEARRPAGRPDGRRGRPVARPLDRRLAGRSGVLQPQRRPGDRPVLPPDQRQGAHRRPRGHPPLADHLAAPMARRERRALRLPSVPEGAVALGAPSGIGVRHPGPPRARRPRRTPEPKAGQLIAAGPGAAAYWRSQLRFGLAGNTVEPLIDGPAAFRAIQQAIESAENSDHFIYLLGWWTDPWVNLTGPGTCLLDLFARAGRRGVQVRVLVWDAPWLFARQHSNLHDDAVHAINRLPNCHAEQDDSGSSRKSHHQKLLVVQGRDGLVALCGGVDINADRVYDLPPPRGSYRADRPHAAGRIAAQAAADPEGSGNPLHDVHARLTGPTALPLLRVFLRRWWARSGKRDIDRRSPLRGSFTSPFPRPTGSQFVRVGETFNGVLHRPDGNVSSRQVTVQDIWLRSILGARRFIYMEEQYLLSDCAAAAIRAVLPRLAHVTILIAPSEITDMPGVWARRRTFISSITAGNPYADRLHIYTRTAGQRQPCIRANAPHLYVHAKMAVIDDELMLIGSANCNNRGWETDSELVIASFEDDGGTSAVAGGCAWRCGSTTLACPAPRVADPVNSRQLWDTASTRRVCRYDPDGGHDAQLSDRPDFIVDPSDREPGDPCRALLSASM